MLSILIPIYNYDVTSLVIRLAKQCEKAKINYEIICFDDGSRERIKAKNQALRSVFRVNYVEMSENLGRAKIRNWLAKAASFDRMLFMDCDSKVPGSHFIQNYVDCIKEHQVVYGGRTYTKKMPKSKKKQLHWKYGTAREALNARKRSKRPYLNFLTNNFVIDSQLYARIKLDETITQYGYEDTLFAERLKELNVPIKHIDNPLQHKGVETTKVFLEKLQKATSNLATLYKTKALRHTRLIDFYERLKYWKLLPTFLNYYEKNQNRIESRLMEENPKLRYLQMHKLWLFHQYLNA